MSTRVQTDLLAIARGYADRPDDWPFAPRFDPVKRWYHRLSPETADEDVAAEAEVWLLTWLPGQETELHDHGGSAGAFIVVSGTLTERTLRSPASALSTLDSATLDSTTLPAGAGRRFDAHHIHQLRNDGTRPAVSVHAYGPALATMTRYRLDEGRLRVESVDRAGVQW